MHKVSTPPSPPNPDATDVAAADSAGPITVAVVGAGHRSVGYAKYALAHPERMRLVAVAEPQPHRRDALAEAHGVPRERRFESYEEVVARPGLADAVINGTMDRMHHESTLALLEAGYHVLLEKPIARTEAEVRGLVEAAARHRRTLMICHVLRYAPFYREVKRLLDTRRIGEVMSLRTSENVSYHHVATGFVRGRWNRRDVNPILLAKCCHDMDLIAWLMSGIAPTHVSSFGARTHFRPEQAPAGSAARCLNGCTIEPTCPYSAKSLYVDQNLWPFYAWEAIEHLDQPTDEQKLESLRTDNPMGRCVWHCNNDVVDHQTVAIAFSNGVSASHDLLTNTARPTRTIHVVGGEGELFGDFESGMITLRRHNPAQSNHYAEQNIDVNAEGGGGQGGHGGGDDALIHDFASVLHGQPTSPGATHIHDSLTGHLLAFAADEAMREQRVVRLSS